MRAAVYYNNKDIRIEEKPIPEIGPDEILMKIEACGICGSDVMEWYRIKKAPLVLGHEVSGTVHKKGAHISQYAQGQRIVAAHHVPCNTCKYCISGNHTVCDTLRSTNFDPGGFTEYVRLPAINVDRGVFPIADSVTFEDATFVEPLACVYRGQKKAQIKPGQSVLIFGGGISGLLHVKCARALGAGRIVVIDVLENRLKAALEYGADYAYHASEYSPEKFREINNGYLADNVIVCTSATSAFEAGFASLERGATMLIFAPTQHGLTMPLSLNDIFWKNDATVTTTYAGSPEDHVIAHELIRSGRIVVSDMISHSLGLRDTVKGFHLVSEGKASIKVIIKPQE
ncbi:MAG: alcohol dehydrogenase catalytic domain-containing protein [Candidatus Ancaeobacter aquaticus]|nr:alcohol dehydrogenase catalytic domain-containing protein [Candidatus Ancaeobacter aquaticus]